MRGRRVLHECVQAPPEDGRNFLGVSNASGLTLIFFPKVRMHPSPYEDTAMATSGEGPLRQHPSPVRMTSRGLSDFFALPGSQAREFRRPPWGLLRKSVLFFGDLIHAVCCGDLIPRRSSCSRRKNFSKSAGI